MSIGASLVRGEGGGGSDKNGRGGDGGVLISLVLVSKQIHLQVDVMNLEYLGPTLGRLNQ